MTTFGTVTGTIGLLQQTRQLVTEIYQRYRLEKQVPEKCDKVNKGLDEIDRILHELQGYDAGNMPEMGRRQMTAIFEYVEHTKKALEAEMSKRESSSKLKRIFQARKVSQMLGERIDKLEKMVSRGLILGVAGH